MRWPWESPDPPSGVMDPEENLKLAALVERLERVTERLEVKTQKREADTCPPTD